MTAIALKVKIFNSPQELALYVQNNGTEVVTIVSINFDSASGKYSLFYKST